MAELPMFPLGTVLLPTMLLPLRIFEPRYRAMIAECLDGDHEFGVCLIERGREVGGGDSRTHVGTVAQILRAEQFGDGQWRVVTKGTRRIVIDDWLPDDPYPRALVTEWPDPEVDTDLSDERERSVDLLRQALAYQSELGQPGPPATVAIDGDPALAAYQISGLAPIGPFDRHRLLGAVTVIDRYAMLEDLLEGAVELLHAQLTMG